MNIRTKETAANRGTATRVNPTGSCSKGRAHASSITPSTDSIVIRNTFTGVFPDFSTHSYPNTPEGHAEYAADMRDYWER